MHTLCIVSCTVHSFLFLVSLCVRLRLESHRYPLNAVSHTGARSSYHAATPAWTPAQAPSPITFPDRVVSASSLGLHGSMLGSLERSQYQQGSANHMSSQIQLAASQLAAPPDPALHNPLAYKQLMLQVCRTSVFAHCCCCGRALHLACAWYCGSMSCAHLYVCP